MTTEERARQGDDDMGSKHTPGPISGHIEAPTPGPWTAKPGPRGIGHDIMGPTAGLRGIVACLRPGCVGAGLYVSARNARLIAAAPDLLAACEAARLQLEPLGHDQPPDSPIGRVLSRLDDAIGEAR